MLELPLISIAVCTFNGKNHLHEQLQSLVNQSYNSKEIIIVDDKSTDGTFEILKAYEQNYSFVKVFQNENNLGYIKNFEKAITKCRGEYICLCDQDDVWNLDKLSILQKNIKADSNLIYHDSALVDSKGISLNRKLSKSIGFLDNSDSRNLLLNNCVAGHSVMFRQELNEYILPLPKTIPHDHWLVYIAAKVGKVQFLQKVLVNYRQHNFSLTFTEHSKDNQRLEIANQDKKIEKLKLNNLRIKHLNTLKSFGKQSKKEIIFIEKLSVLLSEKPFDKFAFKLFCFLILNQNRLFRLYHKSLLSTSILIFKECKSN